MSTQYERDYEMLANAEADSGARDLAKLLSKCRPGVILTSAEIEVLREASRPRDLDHCTEHSCPYHGERNQARAFLREIGDAPGGSLD